MTDVTQILTQIEQGDPKAAEQLLPLVYEELRKLAAARLAHEKPGQTVQATALVHEAYLRLVDAESAERWNSRGHFFAAAAEAMRRILVERARQKRRLRHGGGLKRFDVGQIEIAEKPLSHDLLDLDEAIEKLSEEESMTAEVVKLRYFAGLTMQQVAEYLGISLRTANRHWAYAKAWLYQTLGEDRRTAE